MICAQALLSKADAIFSMSVGLWLYSCPHKSLKSTNQKLMQFGVNKC